MPFGAVAGAGAAAAFDGGEIAKAGVGVLHSNTSAEVVLASLVIPAGTIIETAQLMRWHLLMQVVSLSSGNVAHRVYINGSLGVEVTGLISTGFFGQDFMAPSATFTDLTDVQLKDINSGLDISSVDFSADVTVEFRAQMSVADGFNSLRNHSAFLGLQ